MLHFSLDVFRLAARDAVSFLTTLLGPSVPEAILAELTYRGHLKPVSQCVIEAIIDLGGLKRTALNVDIVTLDQTHRAVKVLEAEDPDGLAPTARLQELEVEAIAEHAAKLYRKRTLGDSPRDTDAMKRIAQFFAKVVPEGLDQIRRIVEGPSTVNDKLLALEQLGVIRQLTRGVSHKTGGNASLVSRPAEPTGATSQRSYDYVPASQIFMERFDTYKQFRRWLDSIGEEVVRRYKPRRNRLMVHAGDWYRFWGDVDKQAWKRVDDAIERAEAVRKRRKSSRSVFAQAEAPD